MIASTSSIKSKNICSGHHHAIMLIFSLAIAKWTKSETNGVLYYTSLFVYLTPVLLQGTLDSWPVGKVLLTLLEGGRERRESMHTNASNPSNLLWVSSDCANNISNNAWWFDELLEYVGLRCQGIPIVQHLFEQLHRTIVTSPYLEWHSSLYYTAYDLSLSD